MVKVIGIAGRAGSGKDPAAQVLAGFTTGPTQILRLATGLKHMLAGLYGIIPHGPAYDRLFETSEGKQTPSPSPLRPGHTVRDDLIRLGDATRAINEDVWVDDLALHRIRVDTEFVLIPDVRYRNELEICDTLIWMGPDTPGAHPTEAELSSADADHVFGFGDIHARLAALRAAAPGILR